MIFTPNFSRRYAGGITRSRQTAVLAPDTPDIVLERSEDVSGLIADSINRVRRGQLDPKVGNAIGYLATVQLRSFEQGMLEKRLAKVESSLGLISIPVLAHSDQEVEAETDGNSRKASQTSGRGD
jgi:hypothetical protein